MQVGRLGSTIPSFTESFLQLPRPTPITFLDSDKGHRLRFRSSHGGSMAVSTGASAARKRRGRSGTLLTLSIPDSQSMSSAAHTEGRCLQLNLAVLIFLEVVHLGSSKPSKLTRSTITRWLLKREVLTGLFVRD